MNTSLHTLAALCLAALPLLATAEALEVKKYGEVYQGQGIEQVELAYIEGRDEALVRIQRVNHEWDGKVLKVRIERLGPEKGSNLVLEHAGQPFTLLAQRGGAPLLFLPGFADNPIRLGYDRNASFDAQPLHLRSAYLQQEQQQ